MLHLTDGILSKSSTEINVDNETGNAFIEINLRAKKLLISCTCNSRLKHIKHYLRGVGKFQDITP